MPEDPGIEFGATIRSFGSGQKVFGRFVLERMLGRGGMGVVWLARDAELEREVALKFLPEMVAADRMAIEDLKRETRRALELTHPHIVRVYDFRKEDELAGISMEFVNGRTLTDLRFEKPNKIFEVEDLDAWMEQLSEALEYAHTKARVVHRDIKPSNLMVDERGELKVTDFGISASVSDSVTRVSRVASSSGSPPYMSPQQVMGEPATPADDIYSVGAMLYELLTGKPPFYAGNILAQVQTRVPPTIAERRRELEVTGRAVPDSWESTIAACLAKEASDRPATIRDLRDQLLGKAGSTPPVTRGVDEPETATAAVAPNISASAKPEPEAREAAAEASGGVSPERKQEKKQTEASAAPRRRFPWEVPVLLGVALLFSTSRFQLIEVWGLHFGVPVYGVFRWFLVLAIGIPGLLHLFGTRFAKNRASDLKMALRTIRLVGLVEVVLAAAIAAFPFYFRIKIGLLCMGVILFLVHGPLLVLHIRRRVSPLKMVRLGAVVFVAATIARASLHYIR